MIRIDTPHGPFVLQSCPDGTLAAHWGDGPRAADCGHAIAEELADRLRRFFDGDEVSFDDIPTPGGPPYFVRCWNACRAVPAGTTISYGELARRAGGSAAGARAAGQALRRNPLPVIVPCHRVVGGDGALHGYAGSTDRAANPLARKRWLLDLEAAGAPAVG